MEKRNKGLKVLSRKSTAEEKASEYDYFKTGQDSTEPRNTKDKKKWVRCKEAVNRYGVSRGTIMNWAISSGALCKIDATVLIDTETLDRYIESFRVTGEYY